VFSVLKELIYFGEKPYSSTDYNLVNSFIGSYEQLQKNSKDAFKLEAEIEGSIKYQSESILNLQIKHYTYRRRSWLSRATFFAFDPETGKSIPTSIV
jgi:hypothetical protein